MHGAGLAPQVAAAETVEMPSAVGGSIAPLLTGREHVAGDALVRQINALNDGLTRKQWAQWTGRVLSVWRPGAWQWPTLRPTDLAAVRSLYFWWDSAQPHRRADELANDVARTAPVTAPAAVESDAAGSDAATLVEPLAEFEAIIDGPGRYLYLRSEWTPPSPELLARAQSALSAQESAPACGADGADLSLDAERCGDPLENWLGCDSYGRYAAPGCGGISAEETARWIGKAVEWLLPSTAEVQVTSVRVIGVALEAPRLVGLVTQELAALRHAAESLAAAGGAAGSQSAPAASGNSEAKRLPAPHESRGL